MFAVFFLDFLPDFTMYSCLMLVNLQPSFELAKCNKDDATMNPYGVSKLSM